MSATLRATSSSPVFLRKKRVDTEAYINALLADLQNTVPGSINKGATSGYGSLNAPRVITSPHTVQPLSSYHSHGRSDSYGSSNYGTTTSAGGGGGGVNSPTSPRGQRKVYHQTESSNGGSNTVSPVGTAQRSNLRSTTPNSGVSFQQQFQQNQGSYQGSGNYNQGGYQQNNQYQQNAANQGLYQTGKGPAQVGNHQYQQNQRQFQSPVNQGAGAGGVGGVGGPASNNLSELDSLLQDLSNAHYSSVYDKNRSVNGGVSPVYASPNGTPGPRGSLERPTVDSLLEELSAAAPLANSTVNHYANGDSLPRPGRQVTITVRETTTEPVYASTQNQSTLTQQYRNQPNEELIRAAQFSETKRAPNTRGQAVLSERMTTHMVRHIDAAPPPAASSATRELDDLMASLSDFKINAGTHQHQTVTETSNAKAQTTQGTHRDQLDSMLGNLQADMSRQGVNTAQKGCCNACDKAIVGQVITALGKTWHPEHFVCTHCNQELGTRNFFERDGHPYCEPDYHNLFSPRCAYCNGAILDKCVTALEKTWHTEHFFCAQCGQQFGEDGFHERDGKPYCRNDYFDMFAPKCGGCNRPIMENYISALNSQWHPDCFVCRDCLQPFHQGSFFDHEGLPYCETHYHAKRGSLCAGCHKPIAGRCITAMFRKFHPEHFVCAFCLKQLNKGTFKEQNDKPYCHNCFDKLFG